MAEFESVLRVDDLADNSTSVVNVHGSSVLICRTADGFFAVENRCPHQAQTLEGGRIRNGYISCPLHGMRFRLATGEALGRLTNKPLKTFKTRVVDGEIQVCVGE
ncbi:MAG: Rieske 2Fe-2S domain-containing protein [Betaproteobacteria bacterium]|nr:Rieske 2Fe-2S domain-containing protein [Betaproteobacteria bacterium]